MRSSCSFAVSVRVIKDWTYVEQISSPLLRSPTCERTSISVALGYWRPNCIAGEAAYSITSSARARSSPAMMRGGVRLERQPPPPSQARPHRDRVLVWLAIGNPARGARHDDRAAGIDGHNAPA